MGELRLSLGLKIWPLLPHWPPFRHVPALVQIPGIKISFDPLSGFYTCFTLVWYHQVVQNFLTFSVDECIPYRCIPFCLLPAVKMSLAGVFQGSSVVLGT